MKKSKVVSKPSEVIASIINKCPETNERQKIVEIGGAESGYAHFTFITRGKSTAWKHTLISEEVDPADFK